ncbi:MAG TPA: polymer-forming cytoskeletal protein [Gelria sp.]|nr:polymer-forming cytoskeletal protein [Gelria sp.]
MEVRKKRRSFQNIESLISPGVEIKGDISSQGSIRIDGYVEGNLNIKGDLILGDKGKIKGEVKAENIIIAGKIEGTATAGTRLEIAATGTIVGDINATTLIIEEGGLLDGTSRMTRAKEFSTDNEHVISFKKGKYKDKNK